MIARANATEYGLVAYVFSGDFKRALQVCERLDYGMVGLNRGLVSDPAAPFGGTKQPDRPRTPGNTGYIWAYISGAVYPERGAIAALVMPGADTPAMSAHLAEISKTVAEGAHANVVLDGAGRHGSKALYVPGNITSCRCRHMPRS